MTKPILMQVRLQLFDEQHRAYIEPRFQIEDDQPSNYLTEVRLVTMVSVSIIPTKCTTYELISLVDQLYEVIQTYGHRLYI